MVVPRWTILLGLLATGHALAQSDPVWWSGVIRSTDTPTANNYAPANLGQLKNFAEHAAAHLDEKLPSLGGADSNIHNMVSAWPSAGANNYQPVNLGQLKFVADKFYARLKAVGFDYQTQLVANGYAGAWTSAPDGGLRPWNESASLSTNYVPANLGQLKILFSFDLTGFTADSDDDGLSDAWELAHFGDLSHDKTMDTDHDGVSDVDEINAGTAWNDFWNGQPPLMEIIDGDAQGDAAGATLGKPLTVRVSNANGAPASTGSVYFSIYSGGGTIVPVNGGNIDANGLAKANLILPSTEGTTIHFGGRIDNSYGFSGVVATATTGDPSLQPAAPGMPVVTEDHGASVATVEWSDNSNNETAFYIERQRYGEAWVRLASLPANTTTFTDTTVIPDVVYAYRIIAHNDAP